MKATNYRNNNLPDAIAIALLFLWIGFVAAISFMEAWLKFSAPGVSLTIGLGIGKLVFGALNSVEWSLVLLLLLLTLASTSKQAYWKKNGYFIAAFCLLTLETCWLLPRLDARANALLRGEALTPGFLHQAFVLTEVLKVLFLLAQAVIELLSIKSRSTTFRSPYNLITHGNNA